MNKRPQKREKKKPPQNLDPIKQQLEEFGEFLLTYWYLTPFDPEAMMWWQGKDFFASWRGEGGLVPREHFWPLLQSIRQCSYTVSYPQPEKKRVTRPWSAEEAWGIWRIRLRKAWQTEKMNKNKKEAK